MKKIKTPLEEVESTISGISFNEWDEEFDNPHGFHIEPIKSEAEIWEELHQDQIKSNLSIFSLPKSYRT